MLCFLRGDEEVKSKKEEVKGRIQTEIEMGKIQRSSVNYLVQNKYFIERG